MFLKIASAVVLSLGLAGQASAQFQGNYTANPYQPNRINPYETKSDLYTSGGEYRGNANSNRFDPNSTSNPYGRYGSQYSPDSINNPYGAGSRYNQDSPTNPFGQGLKACGVFGCE